MTFFEDSGSGGWVKGALNFRDGFWKFFVKIHMRQMLKKNWEFLAGFSGNSPEPGLPFGLSSSCRSGHFGHGVWWEGFFGPCSTDAKLMSTLCCHPGHNEVNGANSEKSMEGEKSWKCIGLSREMHIWLLRWRQIWISRLRFVSSEMSGQAQKIPSSHLLSCIKEALTAK